jgi:hypothetical protein
MWNEKAKEGQKAHMREEWKQKKPSNEEMTSRTKSSNKALITQVTLFYQE